MDFTQQIPYKKIRIDSREVLPGDLFVALEGEKTDGHQHIQEAIRRGCAGAVVHKKVDVTVPLIYVEDTKKALQNEAKKWLQKHPIPIIGVTGSCGKTTTKEFLTTLLREKYKVACNPLNHNTQLTLPTTLLNEADGDEDWIVLEMGMTDPGDIAKLVDIAPPTIALLTNVGLVHAMNFSSIEEITRAKAEIFGHPKTKKCFAPFDLAHKEILTVEYSEWDMKNVPNTHIPGEHNRKNLAAAIAVAKECGVEDTLIESGLKKLKLPEKRLEFVNVGGVQFINDAYNANEYSVKAALDVVSELESERKCAVLGEMLELGTFSDECHERVAEHALGKVDHLVCYGKKTLPLYTYWKKRNKSCRHFFEKQELAAHLQSYIKSGDAVLVKASQANKMWTVIDDFTPAELS